MGQRYLIDTNVLIDVQMDRLPKKGRDFLAKVMDDNFIVSFITQIEFLGYKDVPESSETFISLADVIEIDKQTICACIDLRKNHKIKLPDAIIAATAIVNNLTLLTRNISDFKNIENLHVLNLYEME
ncbi:motility twitching protein PilT [Bacteroidia bacterium]|nr:motility twitching protein PilT [Bacteroidia bacterium]